MNYYFHILILFEIYLILTLSLNLNVGYTGLLSLSQASLFGIGAYCSVIFMVKANMSFFISMFFAVLFNVFIISPILTFFAHRLRNLYFTIASLAFQIIFFGVAYNWTRLTNGSLGISGIPRPVLFGFEFNSVLSFVTLTSFILILTILFYARFHKSHICMMMECTRDNEMLLSSLGKSPLIYKYFSIAISSSYAAIAGGIYAAYVSYIDPTNFTIDESILILTMVFIGGAGNIKGSMIGVLIYIVLPEILRFIHIPDTVAANLRIIIFSLFLIVIIRFKPNGIFGKFEMR
jgi:branched-chain amino acid transport system permease protein